MDGESGERAAEPLREFEESSRMRRDWNARAREDAGYYVAFGRRDQDDTGFFATAQGVVHDYLETELRRVPAGECAGWKALEIGCGPGRLMRPMSGHFLEIHGIDVADEMVALAREKLRDVPNAFAHVGNGASLEPFADNSFGFVYSYAVFQHIPSREVVFQYLREIRRVLKPDGLARLQLNGLPESGGAYNTWAGARFTSNEILEFTRSHDFQVLALEGAGTQYMWTTWKKRPAGWHALLENADRSPELFARIRRITHSVSTAPLSPCRGPYAAVSLWVENLPAQAGLHELRLRIGDSFGLGYRFGTIAYIAPEDRTGLRQVAVRLPELETTGLYPVELLWCGRAIVPAATLRLIPPGPSVPQIKSVTDGVNLVAWNRIETRHVKITIEEVARPEEIEAHIGCLPVRDLEYFCTDPGPRRFEVNFLLPQQIGPGAHALEVRIGRRKLIPVMLEVVR